MFDRSSHDVPATGFVGSDEGAFVIPTEVHRPSLRLLARVQVIV